MNRPFFGPKPNNFKPYPPPEPMSVQSRVRSHQFQPHNKPWQNQTPQRPDILFEEHHFVETDDYNEEYYGYYDQTHYYYPDNYFYPDETSEQNNNVDDIDTDLTNQTEH